jgi:WD40 repeat protein
VAFSSEGQKIATGSWDGELKLWKASSGNLLRTICSDTNLVFWDVAFSPDNRQIITGCGDGWVRVWAVDTGRQILAFSGHNTAPVLSVSFSSDGRKILSSGEDGTASVWDAGDGANLFRRQERHRLVRAVFSPDGQCFATASEDALRSTAEDAPITIWDATDGRKLLTLPGQVGGVSNLAYSPDGRHIVSGGMGRTAVIWDTSTGRMVHSLDGHSDQVIRVLFTGGRNARVITGCFDHTSKVWDAATGQELVTLRGPVIAAVSPTGRHFVTVDDPPVKVWSIATPEEVENWRQKENPAE